MNRKLLLLLVALLTLTPFTVFAEVTSDIGIIDKIYSDTDGVVAFHLKNGILNASSIRVCGADNEWVGFIPSESDNVVTLLLTAKANGEEIEVLTDGCFGEIHKLKRVMLTK